MKNKLIYFLMMIVGILFVIPTLGGVSIGFIIGGAFAVIVAIFKVLSLTLGYNLPFTAIAFPYHTFPETIECLIAFVVGTVLLIVGIIVWRAMVSYFKIAKNYN